MDQRELEGPTAIPRPGWRSSPTIRVGPSHLSFRWSTVRWPCGTGPRGRDCRQDGAWIRQRAAFTAILRGPGVRVHDFIALAAFAHARSGHRGLARCVLMPGAGRCPTHRQPTPGSHDVQLSPRFPHACTHPHPLGRPLAHPRQRPRRSHPARRNRARGGGGGVVGKRSAPDCGQRLGSSPGP